MKFSIFLTIYVLNSVRSDQVVLLDTTKEATLEWTRYPYGPQTLTPGWVEESFTNFGRGINWRSYVVCDVAYNNVNNWLWSPFIDRGPANRLYIEIQFTIRDCSLFPGNALSCKETFSLLFYEFDAATREPPPWQPESYKLIARIAAGEGRFNQNSDVDINTEVKSIAVTKKGVYFAFRDQGACISVLAVKVYYITCPAVTENFAHFKETPTGREITLIEKQNGSCVANAEVDEIPPTYLCKGDGKWTILSGGCKCKVGYEADNEKQVCKECPPGSFRSSEIKKCTKCPSNSSSSSPASEFCKCDTNFFRNASGNHLPCYRPPGAPRNLSIIFVDPNTATITWEPPSLETSIFYSIKCSLCPVHSTIQPSTPIFNDTKVTISNLEPGTSYIVQVFSHANNKDVIGNFSEVFFTTDNTISTEILKIYIEKVSAREIFLKWEKPHLQVEFYEIRWFLKGSDIFDSNKTFSAKTKEEEFVVQNLSQNTEYGVQVRWKTSNGFGSFSNIMYALTQNGINTVYDDSAQMRIYAGATITIVIVLVIIIFATIFFFRTKSHDELEKKTTNHLPLSMDYASNEVNSLDTTPIVKSKTNVTTPLFNASRTYVDPHTYEDPNQAIREFAREIDASYITIEAIIGGGEFGDVCRGRLKIPPNFLQDIDVAIKTLKPGSSEKARCDFLTEASIMGQFDHPNVIYLQGVVTRSNPVMIITEFMENGSLDTFLRANDGKFQTLQLIGMLRGISSGMSYLSDMNYVHRDLAARNVLVNAQLVCKIADFGLSREIENASDAYTTRGGKIPVRWTAPEAIAFRKFTSASDVWSYGVVLWEVMSYGERPYWNWSNQDVIKSIEKGYRLPAPMDCPEALYQLMLDCWQKQRTHRPTFTSIVSTLDNLARQPHILVAAMMTTTATTTATKNSPEECNFGSSDEPQQTPGYNLFISTDLWLESIKMTRYSQQFKDTNLVTAQQISRLTAQQLTDMGITLVGHQKKIIHQARQLDTII